MFKVNDIFVMANDLLPKDEIAKSVSVYPLPYDNFYEVFVECESGKKFRALANHTQTLSNFSEFKLPGGTK